VNWLVAVEGTNWDCSVLSCAWGENLEGVRRSGGVTFDLTTYGANRFVWSPHVYGSDVTQNADYSEEAWEAHWGYLVDGSHATNEAASVIGEFGTKYDTTNGRHWLDDLITYLLKIEQRNTFYWCMNPNSGDTGGLLQSDWTTDETEKLAQLERLQPNPSKFEYDAVNGQVCVRFEGDTVTATGSPVTSLTPSPTTRSPVTSNTPSPTTPQPTSNNQNTPLPTTRLPSVSVTPSPSTNAPVTATASPTSLSPSTSAPVTASPNVSPQPTTSTPSIDVTPDLSAAPTTGYAFINIFLALFTFFVCF